MKPKVTMNSAQIMADFADAAIAALQETGVAQEQAIKAQLWPGHGVDTEAMKKSVHYAGPGYPWDADAVPASPGAPERGGQTHYPRKVARGVLGALFGSSSMFVIEAGSGQDYALYYHEKRDAFVRNGVDQANRDLPERLATQMQKRGY